MPYIMEKRVEDRGIGGHRMGWTVHQMNIK